ncbi:hypothetical protein CQA49_06870 [Helicobacter sp. MIT 00-7814]|uniref:hypothetical protein n=1 Tax=unclassified Helicobacter TaxID=2593540 RepID=UPI000E1E3907|nr:MULTISPECIES: hypothetical protein [unclassified Helicobacter]RDU53364.1 hypothetical protein CQA49_06870 [Helicobacter sp. MIT 00-7814]RDU54185.1 hypothetical protein CQA37_06110 [Helicobacter sp. MIT 99-10781]
MFGNSFGQNNGNGNGMGKAGGFGNQHWKAQYQDAKSEKEAYWQLKNHQGSQPRQQPMSPKEKSRYPIFSDVQELQDELQSLYASGSAFTEQKTIDITESEYRMLPFKIFRIVGKGLMFIFLFFLITFGFFVLTGVLQSENAFVYPISLIMFFCSLFFYAYVVYSMRQFVIPSEKQPKTKQFYAQVKAGWRFVEFILVMVSIGLIVAEYTFDKWANILSPLFSQIQKLSKNYVQLTPQIIENSLFHTAGVSIILVVTYFLFVYWANKRFTKMQHQNVYALQAQYDRAEATKNVLDGEI